MSGSPIQSQLQDFKINDLLPKYKDFLKRKIPILNDELLLGLILDYCYESMKNNRNKIQRLKNIIESLKNIEKYLREIHDFFTIHNNESKKATINTRNRIIIKSSPISAEALIEGIICTTLEFYDSNITANSYVNLKKNETGRNRLFIRMNRIIGKPLGTYIMEDIYNNENIPQNMKNEVLMIVFKKISEKLLVLQESCGFIHGDFHGENIFVIPINNGNDIDIKFIDFGFSVLRLPTTGKKIILTGAVPENYQRPYVMDLTSISDEKLKALDLFHLLQSLKGIENNIVVRNSNYYFKFDMHDPSNETLIKFNDYDLFHGLLEYLSSLYLIDFNTKKFRSLIKYHDFTRSNNFYNIDNEYHILYPENFIKLDIGIINDNGNANGNSNNKSNNNYNNGNENNKKKFSKIPHSLKFGNNNGNENNNNGNENNKKSSHKIPRSLNFGNNNSINNELPKKISRSLNFGNNN